MSVLHISALICSKYYLDTMLEKIGVGRGGGHISSELEDVLYFTKINSNLDIQKCTFDDGVSSFSYFVSKVIYI